MGDGGARNRPPQPRDVGRNRGQRRATAASSGRVTVPSPERRWRRCRRRCRSPTAPGWGKKQTGDGWGTVKSPAFIYSHTKPRRRAKPGTVPRTDAGKGGKSTQKGGTRGIKERGLCTAAAIALGYQPLPSAGGANGCVRRERETVPRRYGGRVTRAPVAHSPCGSTARFPTATADPSKNLRKKKRKKNEKAAKKKKKKK